MILVIRIAGRVGLSSNVQETLFRLGLRRKYTAIVLSDTPTVKKMLHTIRDHVAFGPVSSGTLIHLIDKRAKGIDKNEDINAKKVVEDLESKSLKSLGVKPFFRLHPPRGGIESKKHFGVGKGVLGNNKEKINELVVRML